MDPRCLLATLLTVIATKAVFHVGVSGDGVVAAVRHSGEIEIISHEFTKGAPYYLLYSWLGSNHKENYIKEYGSGQFVITKQVVGQEPEVIEHPLEVGMQTQSYTFSKEAYKLVAVMTDGAKSFTKKVKTSTCLTQENIPLDAIVTEMMAFKNFNGTFVDRRCKRAFETFNTNGIKNMDDFSIGVIYDSQE
jgi:preprotein translocase subunit Sec63